MKARCLILLLVASVATLGLLARSSLAQGSSLGWDLSYESVLNRTNAESNALIQSWVKQYRSPAEKWISGWAGEPIVSSVLIEYMAFHAAEHSTIWLVRTKDHAYYWESTEGRENDQDEEDISTASYDSLFGLAVNWQQLTPKPTKDVHEGEIPGYVGFVNTYGPAGSKQMLLTMEDFFICLDSACLPGHAKLGRLMAALEPLLISDEVKNYKHKSEAEIARMTPAERIDEQIREQPYLMNFDDKQGDLISKYRRRDGTRGFPHLIELMETYEPKHMRDSRSDDAVMFADELDRFALRLRASPAGRAVIDAMERLASRMRAAGKSVDQVEWTVRDAKGLNEADTDIQNTLWVKYRIKLSDSQMLEFSNYLVETDPTYPSWAGGRTQFQDRSRKNEVGSYLLVFVLNNPQRFYHAYLTFKRTTKGKR